MIFNRFNLLYGVIVGNYLLFGLNSGNRLKKVLKPNLNRFKSLFSSIVEGNGQFKEFLFSGCTFRIFPLRLEYKVFQEIPILEFLENLICMIILVGYEIRSPIFLAESVI